MRIAMISEHASPLAAVGDVDAGGQNIHVAALAESLAHHGHQVVVYTRRDDPDLPDCVAMCPGVVVEHLTGGPAAPVEKDRLWPLLPRMRSDLARRLPRHRPDVVHAHFWMSGWLARAAAQTHNIPYVQTFHALGAVKRRHQGDADTSPPQRLPTETMLARTATRLTAACTDELRELLTLGARRDRIDVVPCGVDLDRFAPSDAARPTRRIVSVGRLVPRKGVDDVIRALAGVPDVELLIAGGPPADRLDSDPEVRRLRAVAAQSGVAERVRLLGQVGRADLPDLIRSASAVVCTPHYEPFGIVPLEAMACAVPVVGSAVGGLLDTIVDGETGLLVPPRDPDALAAALRTVVNNDDLQRRLGEAGHERAAKYAWPRVATTTEKVYARAVYGRRATTRQHEEATG